MEDRVYKQLKEKLEDDFKPVKPLEKSWKRALWIFPVSLLFMSVFLIVFHLRPDYADFNPLLLWGFIVLQILACYLLLAVSLETCIPGSFGNRFVFVMTAFWGLIIFFAASWINFRISPNRPAPGHEWITGIACISVIGICGILSLLLGFFLVRSGLPFKPKSVGILTGLGSGLAVEAAWRLHCPFTSWDHILIYHGGALIGIVLAGIVLGFYWKRGTSR